MASKAKVGTLTKEKKPVVNTKLVASSPTGKPVPNYLKPTFSSKPEITSKYVKKSSVVHNDESSAQKARLQRGQSFDKSPIATSRVKPMAGATQKPGGPKPVKPSAISQQRGPPRTKKTTRPVTTSATSAPESLSSSPTKSNGTVELVNEDEANTNTIHVDSAERVIGENPDSVDNITVKADESVAESASETEEEKLHVNDELKSESFENLESDIFLKEEESSIVSHNQEENPEKVILVNEIERDADPEQPLKEETNESRPVDDVVSEPEPSVEVKEEPTETIEKSEPSDQVASAVQKKQVVQGKKEAPSAYNDVIEETKNKLLEKKKNKVKALVGAFETVIDYESASK